MGDISDHIKDCPTAVLYDLIEYLFGNLFRSVCYVLIRLYHIKNTLTSRVGGYFYIPLLYIFIQKKNSLSSNRTALPQCPRKTKSGSQIYLLKDKMPRTVFLHLPFRLLFRIIIQDILVSFIDRIRNMDRRK